MYLTIIFPPVQLSVSLASQVLGSQGSSAKS